MDHTLAAMSIARLIRGLTGQGFGRLHLLGFSYGGSVGYAPMPRRDGRRGSLVASAISEESFLSTSG